MDDMMNLPAGFRHTCAGLGLAAALVIPSALTAQVGASQGVLDPNVAGEAEMAILPHMTPALAKGIVAARPFLSTAAFGEHLGKSLTAEQRAGLFVKLFVAIDLNTATREEILMVPGVGNRMLREFLEYRPYPALAKFHREIDKYVDDTELARLEQYVFVAIDLNTATDDAILSIPGVGSRMLREFKEYRPYKSIEQFRREIGKYVDKNELARLERYVTIK
jgi:DNA uptake protein ComE-like DNA-binding protein